MAGGKQYIGIYNKPNELTSCKFLNLIKPTGDNLSS